MTPDAEIEAQRKALEAVAMQAFARELGRIEAARRQPSRKAARSYSRRVAGSGVLGA